MVIMTQAIGSPSASSLQDSGLIVTPGAPALWDGRRAVCFTRWQICENAAACLDQIFLQQGGPDSLFQALKVHIPLEGKVFCGRGLDRDIDAASPQKLSICPAVSKGTLHPKQHGMSQNYAANKSKCKGRHTCCCQPIAMDLHKGMLRRQPA